MSTQPVQKRLCEATKPPHWQREWLLRRLISSRITGPGAFSFLRSRRQRDTIKAPSAMGGPVLVGFLALCFLFSPVLAHAGILSFVSDLFSSTAGIPAETPATNSQTMTLLAPAIHIDPNPAKGGGDITVVGSALLPDAGPSGTIADIEEVRGTHISTYIVRKGDTISSVAAMFDVSSNTILWANDLKKGVTLREGDTLVILPVSGVRYTVVKGDTLASIAKKYKGDVGEIADYNGLSENATLAIGDIIVVPNGEAPSAPVQTGTTRPQQSVPSYSGYYMHPLSNAGHKTQGVHGYNGVDIGAKIGTPVVASASGEVVISRDYGWNGGYGKYVVIKHTNGTQTLYGHLNGTAVSTGQSVVQGQVIGYVGNTGRSTGPHLHFEVRGARNPF